MEKKMVERVPYHPEINFSHLSAFDERLQNLPGSWTLTRSFFHAGDPRVIRLRWNIPDEQWCDEERFLDFLDQRQHRLLLRSFLRHTPITETERDLLFKYRGHEAEIAGRSSHFVIKTEQLLQEMGQGTSSLQLQQALRFLALQEFITPCQEDAWSCGPGLSSIENMGSTFEWIAQACLQHFHHAIARRCVSFKEWLNPPLNDLDVLAFTQDGLAISIECKSTTAISPEHITHFVKRAMAFPADIALLLIDTESTQPITKHLRQINMLLGRTGTESGTVLFFKNSTIVHLTNNIYLANTAGGIATTLEATLQLGTTLK